MTAQRKGAAPGSATPSEFAQLERQFSTPDCLAHQRRIAAYQQDARLLGGASKHAAIALAAHFHRIAECAR